MAPLFADGDLTIPGWAAAGVALLTAVGGLCTGAATALVIVLKVYLPYRLDARRQDAADADAEAARRTNEYRLALDAHRELLKEYDRQAERRDKTISDQQQVIEALQREHIECRQDAAQLRNAVFFVYDALKRHHAALESAGLKPGPMLELPPLRERDEPSAADFLARQAAQKAGLVAEADARLAQRRAEIPEVP